MDNKQIKEETQSSTSNLINIISIVITVISIVLSIFSLSQSTKALHNTESIKKSLINSDSNKVGIQGDNNDNNDVRQ